MADRILVTRDMLAVKANDIRSLKMENQAIMDKLNNLFFSLGGVFEGEAYDAMLNKYMTTQQTIKQFNDILSGYAAAIDKTCQEFGDTERKLVGKYNGI